MAKITMLSGLPASGKTTRAALLLKEYGNAVRVNKDLLRKMLHNDIWTGNNEKNTKNAEKALAIHFLLNGLNVIVDDTNMGQSHKDYWKNVAKETDSGFEHVVIDTPWWACEIRNDGREDRVDSSVIRNMALQYGKVAHTQEAKEFKGWILVDLDGTLCDIEHRLKYARGEEKDWGKFFAGISGDSLRKDVESDVHGYYAQGWDVIIVTARPEEYRKATASWLQRMGVDYYFTILMRKSGDKREDSIVKQQILDTYFQDKSLIHKVFDDRPRVIKMWRENGLEVIDVGNQIDF